MATGTAIGKTKISRAAQLALVAYIVVAAGWTPKVTAGVQVGAAAISGSGAGISVSALP